jgi:hypothetical protein
MITTLSVLIGIIISLIVVTIILLKQNNKNEKIAKILTEENETLRSYLRQNEYMLDVRFSVDTYAMEKDNINYMKNLSEMFARNLAFAIADKMWEKLWAEIKKRIIQRKSLFYCSPLNLEQIILVRVPLYRADVENMYLNSDNIGGIV